MQLSLSQLVDCLQAEKFDSVMSTKRLINYTTYGIP